MKISKNWPVLSLALLLSSCSWLERMERSLVGEEENPRSRPQSAQNKKQLITKAEYDDLLARYEELNRQYQALKDGRASDPLVNELRDAPMIENGTRVETVDAFTGNKSAAPVLDAGDIEGQLQRYRQAQSMRSTSASEAMKIFQELASGAITPIRARSQLGMGEILMQQGEYDLALQAFEGVISKMANSGAVLDALRGAVVCAEKLGLAPKKEQYLSMLRDVFQLGV
ncbi:MAG: tetratricopeptide repeat protein [Bacteriovoracia bacterium]